MENEFVILRTRDAGIHCGTLETQVGSEVILTDARRVWRWRGANTLHELALNGGDDKYTRISEPLPRIKIIGVCEVLPCSDEGKNNLSISRWN